MDEKKVVIELDNVKRDFLVGDETVHALRGVSFKIYEGEFVTIMGKSGSGKSTLLNQLGCLDTPSSGEYYLDGVSVRKMSKSQRAVLRNRKIGFIFQNYNLLPKTTSVENVELPLMYNAAIGAKEREERAVKALQAVGLGERLYHKSNQMSGGQMQRVAIARALVNDPAVILADEATGNLDTHLVRDSHSLPEAARSRPNHHLRDAQPRHSQLLLAQHHAARRTCDKRRVQQEHYKIMNYSNLFKIALRAIAANKLRSFLTALGIIIGVASVITMLAIGQGSKRSIQANIAEMGSNMIMISPGADRGPGGVRQDPSAMETLKLNDYNSIKDECHFIKGISPTVNSSGQWIYGNNNTPSSIYGVNQDYLEIRQLSVSEGEMFTDADIKASAKVCILGQTVVDNLFPDGSDPVGKVVRFNAIPFRVVGVLRKKGYNSMGMDQDDLVLAPYTTVMKRIKAQTFLGGITCSAITEDLTSKAIDEITDVLRRNHKLKEATDVQKADDDDFNIRSQEELASMMNSTTDMMTILLGCVAGISLIVGGIGIMNIMYVSVTERTREIGLRMSVGARGVDILSQFLIEAILLSVTGGLIGVGLGIGASYAVKLLAHWPIYIQPWSIIMSFAVCTFTGVFFGWYPAKKAAQLDPIEAIRYE